MPKSKSKKLKIKSQVSSMDKMTDDCIGLLLSYLPLKDKFRLESVSKQWQRKIFWKVGYLSIELDEDEDEVHVCDMNGIIISKPIDSQVVRLILKKCPNLVRFKMKGSPDKEIVSTIANQCQYLSHLTIQSYFTSYSKEVDIPLKDLFMKCGSKLTKLEILGHIDLTYYSSCDNLEELNDEYNSLVEFKSTHFPKLESIQGCIISLQITSPEFALFCDLYANQLKRAKLRIERCVSKQQLKQFFTQINKFVKLDWISIKIESTEEPIEDAFTASELKDLKKLSVWKKLKQLNICCSIYEMDAELDADRLIIKPFYESYIRPFLYVSDFHLESLQLDIEHDDIIGSITDTFQVCPKLKSLKTNFYTIKRGPHRFYKDMQLRFPNLTQLDIKADIEEIGLFFEISKLSQLKSLKIMTTGEMRDYSIKQIICNYSSSLRGHESIRCLELNFGGKYYCYLPFVDLQSIIQFASTIPSVETAFFPLTDIEMDNPNEQAWRKISKMSIPDNLTVYFERKVAIIKGKIIK